MKLLVNRDSGEAVALKMVDMVKHPEAENAVKKEMLIHKLLKHPNIIKFFGKSSQTNSWFIMKKKKFQIPFLSRRLISIITC